MNVLWIAVVMALVLGFCRPSLTYADDKTWTPAQKVLATTFVTASVVDYFQTISNLYKGGWEIFGIKDDTEAVLVMGGLATAFLLIAHNNPKIRTALLVGGNIVEWGIVAYNNSIGIRINF